MSSLRDACVAALASSDERDWQLEASTLGGRTLQIAVAARSITEHDVNSLIQDATRWAEHVHQRGSARLVILLSACAPSVLDRARPVLARARAGLRAVRIAPCVLWWLDPLAEIATYEHARLGRALRLLSSTALEEITVRSGR
jgi:hypothetical protein